MKLKDFKNIHASGKDLSKVISQGKEIWSISHIPGGDKLIGGDELYGFYGEVKQNDLITSISLLDMVGITKGTRVSLSEPWLKFNSNGSIIYVAKKPFVYGIDWNTINSVGAVYGEKEILYQDHRYKVRLLRGTGQADPKVIQSAFNGPILYESETNKLFVPILDKVKDNSWKYPDNIQPNPEDWGGMYTNEDLGMGENLSNGTYTWTQDQCYRANSYSRRGGSDISGAGAGGYLDANIIHAYRPVLELVE